VGNIDVTLENGKRIQCSAGVTVGSLLDKDIADNGLQYIGASVNNDISSLSYPLTVNCEVRFLTAGDPHGSRIYSRSLAFLLAKAARDVYPSAELWVEHSFGPGLYCSFHRARGAKEGITRTELSRIEARLRLLVERDIAINRHKISFTDAVKGFEQTGDMAKLNLLRYRNPPRVVIYSCENFTDLAHGPLAPSTGVFTKFRLLPYKPGFVLLFPEREKPSLIPVFKDQPQLFHIFREHKEWGRNLGVSTVGQLNQIIANREIDNFIMTAEALHEKKLGQIADQIASDRKDVKIVLIAGPSAAGKTTFAKRLTTHLRVNGCRPATLSTDDYFVGMDKNPVDEDGKPDYEHIDAVDLKLFNSDLLKLIQGKQIQLPTFNFETKKREYRGQTLAIEEDQIVIIEGIHGLNPKLTREIPARNKFKIYVSALTQLSVDSHNRISTTDNRLMRRMVRDHLYRGHSALESIQLWPSVRRGEKRWIFPYQREANATFNSALDYELAVLKPFVEPLLMEVKPFNPEYAEARRLSEFLLSFIGIPDHSVPHNSILREHIGGSSYNY
jgi:uridine kinase